MWLFKQKITYNRISEAIRKSDYELLDFYLSKKPNINNMWSSDGYGNNLLLFAAHKIEDYISTKKLLDAGIDPNIRNSSGNTTIYFVIDNRKYTFVDLLLDYGADVYLYTKSGIYLYDLLSNLPGSYKEKADGKRRELKLKRVIEESQEEK